MNYTEGATKPNMTALGLADGLFADIDYTMKGTRKIKMYPRVLGGILSMYVLLNGDLTKIENLLAKSFSLCDNEDEWKLCEISLRQSVQLQKVEEFLIVQSRKYNKHYHVDKGLSGSTWLSIDGIK